MVYIVILSFIGIICYFLLRNPDKQPRARKMSKKDRRLKLDKIKADYDYILANNSNETDEGILSRGLTVYRTTDNKLLAWQRLPRKEGFESINIVGESYRLAALQDPSFAPGHELKLIPEPDNPHGENAIGVWNNDQTLHVGYIPSSDSTRIKKNIAAGDYDRFFSMWETILDGERNSLRILMINSNASLYGIPVSGPEKKL